MVAFWLSMISLSFYFSMNVLYFDKYGGVYLSLLIIPFFVFLSQFIGLVLKTNKDKIILNNSFMYFVFICLYISYRIIIDKNDIGYFKSFWLSTTGGCLIFFIFGSLISLELKFILNCCNKSVYLKRINYNYSLIYIMSTAIMYAYALIKLLPRCSPDLFLIDTFGLYQRVGNFIVINTILIAYCFFVIEKDKYVNRKILTFSFLSFVTIAAVLSQFLGSNNAFICILGIAVISIYYKFFSDIKTGDKHNIISNLFFKNKHKSIFFKEFICYLLTRIVFVAFLCSFILIAFHNYLPPIRIFGYNKIENYNPLEKRLILINDNFLTQLSVNPIFGNMSADSITTGVGTYPHSFLLSTLTHCGIIGTILVILYLVRALFEYYKQIKREKKYYSYVNYIYLLSVGIFIFLIANVSSFMSWNPLWFSFGYCFPVILIRRY